MVRFVRRVTFFFFFFLGGGVDFRSLSDWLAPICHNVIWPRTATKIKKTVGQITLDLFQNCDVPEEVSGTFSP